SCEKPNSPLISTAGVVRSRRRAADQYDRRNQVMHTLTHLNATSGISDRYKVPPRNHSAYKGYTYPDPACAHRPPKLRHPCAIPSVTIVSTREHIPVIDGLCFVR